MALVEPDGEDSTNIQTDTYLAELGVKYVRNSLVWRNAEPFQGTYNWTPSDKKARRFHALGMDWLPIILQTPDWASGGGGVFVKPNNMQDIGNFTGKAVQRYKPGGDFAKQEGLTDGWGVRVWEIWNEPNLIQFWPTGKNAQEYTSMLQACYIAAKAADPKCYVMNGGLLHGAEIRYGHDMLNAGAKGYFDICALHPYTSGGPPSEMRTTVADFRTKVLDPSGLGDLPVWATEFGYETAGANSVGQALQASYLTEVMGTSFALNLVDVMFWFTLWDGGDITDHYGLVHRFAGGANGLKPSYAAYRDTIPVP